MKTVNSCFVVLLIIGVVSCSNSDNPVLNNISLGDDTTVVLMSDVLPPSISTITGSKGYVSSRPYASYPDHFQAEYNGGSIITLNGSNFGNSQGSSFIKFEHKVNNVWQPVPNYNVSVLSWQNSQLKIKLSVSNTNAIPIIGRIKVTTSGGANEKPFQAVPYLFTRQYGQCTWWCTKRTIENGLPGSNAHYSNVTSNISEYYIPTAKDLLSWGTNVHQAFIESVTVSYEAGNITKYVLRISESNVANTYPTYYTTTVKVKNTNGVKTYVSGYNKYRSTLVNSALYFRSQ